MSTCCAESARARRGVALALARCACDTDVHEREDSYPTPCAGDTPHRRDMSQLEPHYRMTPPDRLPPKPRAPVHVVLDNVRSAFNVGSIFRTADAGSVACVHLCGYTACPPNVKLQKTALGAFDYVPWTHHEGIEDCIAHLEGEGIPLVAVETQEKAVTHTAFEWPKPVAVAFGNEVRGLQPAVLEHARAVVSIPMLGHKNTVNVATAFGIVIFEILRQWRVV